MNFYDDQSTTVGQLFERFFPGREDVIRLLMEPITYANGSTLEDPAISYGIVFSNFMSKGVFTFQGGTDRLIGLMKAGAGAQRRRPAHPLRSAEDPRRAAAAWRASPSMAASIRCRAVVSNANLKSTIFNLVGEEHFDRKFVDEARAVRLNNSSTQVYMALKPGEMIDESCGDLLFSSKAPLFRTELLLEPRHHQPHVLVLLSADAAGERSLPGGLQHQRQLPGLGRPAARKSTRRASRT